MYTDKLEMQAIDPVISETSGILGEQAGLSFDTLLRAALVAGATADYTGNATSTATLNPTTDKANYGDFLGALATLENNSAMAPDGGFGVITTPFAWAQLMQDPTFVALFTREGGASIRQGRMGTILNCAVYISSNAYSVADTGVGGADVHSLMFIGKEAFGIAGMGNTLPQLPAADGGGEALGTNMTGKPVKPVEILIKGLGETGFDPLNQRGTIGWKATYDDEILNADWIVCQYTVTMYG